MTYSGEPETDLETGVAFEGMYNFATKTSTFTFNYQGTGYVDSFTFLPGEEVMYLDAYFAGSKRKCLKAVFTKKMRHTGLL